MPWHGMARTQRLAAWLARHRPTASTGLRPHRRSALGRAGAGVRGRPSSAGCSPPSAGGPIPWPRPSSAGVADGSVRRTRHPRRLHHRAPPRRSADLPRARPHPASVDAWRRGRAGHGTGASRCGMSSGPCAVEVRPLGCRGAQMLGDAAAQRPASRCTCRPWSCMACRPPGPARASRPARRLSHMGCARRQDFRSQQRSDQHCP